LGQVAVKVMAARAFEMVVVELDAVAMGTGTPRVTGVKSGKKGWAPEVLVRKLALLAEEAGSTVLLMTAGKAAGRGAPLPVALRLELERPKPEALALRIAKDRRGRGGLAKTVPFPAWTGTGGGGLSEVG
jgi:hypothetical protein